MGTRSRFQYFTTNTYLYLYMLLNFAGNVEMYGILDAIASGPVEARITENSTMVGVGMSMEGIEKTPIVYDLMSEMAFQRDKVDVKDKNRDVIVAFPDVNLSLITITHKRYHCDGKLVSRRAILTSDTNSYDQPHLWYSTSEVIRALEIFIANGDELSASNTYRTTRGCKETSTSSSPSENNIIWQQR